jgi:hypothetical protein
VRIEELQGNIVQLSDIREEKLRALSPYGPVKAGLTTWPNHETPKDDPLVQLLELLNSLESAVDHLNFKSFTVYDTLVSAIEGVRVALYDSIIEKGGTDETS